MDPAGLPLLRKIVDQISAHPETHDQDIWAWRAPQCGTVACIAGWAVTLSPEAEPIWVIESEGVLDLAGALIDGRRYSVPAAAQRLLGLTSREADRLFYAPNVTVWLAVERLTGGELRRPNSPAA